MPVFDLRIKTKAFLLWSRYVSQEQECHEAVGIGFLSKLFSFGHLLTVLHGTASDSIASRTKWES